MILMRRSNIVMRQDPDLAIELAADAAAMAQTLPSSRLHASIARQQALAALAARDHQAFAEHAFYAADLAQADAIDGDLAAYATAGYVVSETATGLLILGRAEHAADQLRAHIAAWPDGQQRDQAVAHTRLIRALAAAGDYTTALDVSEAALRAVRAAPSARARHELDLLWRLLQDRARADRSLPLTTLRRRIIDARQGDPDA